MNDEAVFGNEMSSIVKREAELYIPWYDQQRRARSLISAFAVLWLDS